jgi:hypothetical protein
MPRTLQRDTSALFGLVTGGTGTGKTSLILSLIPQWKTQRPRVLVLDMKGDYEDANGSALSVPDAIRWLGTGAPGLQTVRMMNTEKDRNFLGQAIWHFGSVFVIADEFQNYGDSRTFHEPVYERIVREGRSWGIEMVVVTQSTTGIPKTYLTNATDICMFRSNNHMDVHRLRSVVGNVADDLPNLALFRARGWGTSPKIWKGRLP